MYSRIVYFIYQGDACRPAKGSVRYTCKKIADCPSAFDSIRNDEKPEICGYIGFTPVVCCKSSNDSPPVTTPAPPPSTAPAFENKQDPQKGFKSISERSK